MLSLPPPISEYPQGEDLSGAPSTSVVARSDVSEGHVSPSDDISLSSQCSPTTPMLQEHSPASVTSSSHINDPSSPNIVDVTSLDTASVPTLPPPRHPMVTRSQHGIQKPNPRYALVASKTIPSLPQSMEEALAHPGWRQAMIEELESIYQNCTWKLTEATSDMNILGCRWVFTVKLNADRTASRLKARLIAKGFHQEESVDFVETFSHVVRTSMIRTVLSVATAKRWSITQLDVKNAFLHGDLHEPVFMIQPPGFEDLNHPTHVCSLKKALYGLKQAPRAWFDKFTHFLLEYGFVCSKADPSLFVFHHNGETLVLLLYVDDILLTGSNSLLFKSLIAELNTRFSMKDLGNLHYFLGIQVHSTSHGLFLCQTKYAEEILHTANMSTCNPVHTPLPLRLVEVYKDRQLFSDPSYFRSLAGKLQYLTLTRPDIQFAVNFICQRMHSPTYSDFHFLKCLLCYIRGTSTMGLQLYYDCDLSVTAYSDSDWAGCHDTRRSTGGFCVFLGSNLVSWSARRQPTVSRSSTEAEYRALATTASELTWISFVLRDLGISQASPALLKCDNQSAVRLSANPVFHARSKHIEVDYHYVRERVALGVLEIHHIPATLQLADIFTKSLPRRDFQRLRSNLNVVTNPNISLRGAESDLQQAQHKRPNIKLNSMPRSPLHLKP